MECMNADIFTIKILSFFSKCVKDLMYIIKKMMTKSYKQIDTTSTNPEKKRKKEK